jgi:hypothetical protein
MLSEDDLHFGHICTMDKFKPHHEMTLGGQMQVPGHSTI